MPGSGTLFDTIVTSAGALNLAASPDGWRSFDIEQVVRARPAVLLRGAATGLGPVLRDSLAAHPVLAALPGLAVIEYPESIYACGVPRAADQALALARQLARVAAAP